MTQTKLKDFNQIILNKKIHDMIELINLDWGWKRIPEDQQSSRDTKGCPTDQIWHTLEWIQNQQFCN